MQKAGGCGGWGLDLIAPRARRSVGPELAFPARSSVQRPELREVVTPPQLGRVAGGEEPEQAVLALQPNPQLLLGQRASCGLGRKIILLFM